jgi:hypothetical protein
MKFAALLTTSQECLFFAAENVDVRCTVHRAYSQDFGWDVKVRRVRLFSMGEIIELIIARSSPFPSLRAKRSNLYCTIFPSLHRLAVTE